MINRKIFLLASIFCLSVFPLNAQKLIRNSLITGVCYAGDKVNRIYIPPPDEYFRKSGKGGASVNIYYSGFPPAAVTAMEYAASILKSVLPSDTKVTVLASWEKISTEGVLANSSTTGYAPGWAIDALEPDAFYPAALAEKILGESLNFDLEGDIELTINSSINWYMGTDGKTPSLAYDLVTVVIHELIHGLGFFDSMNTVSSTGYYGAASIPLIYDTFVENAGGQRLTDTTVFYNPSVALKNELTSGQLYFNGPLLRKFTSGGKAKLYAPSTFDAGSSISHLDETVTLQENQLMTPFISKGEAIHNPGNFTMSMLGDIGWTNTRIDHDPPDDTEEHITNISLSATIISDTAYFRNNIGLVWSLDKFATSDTIIMNSPGGNDTFTADIDIPSYETGLEYYFYVEDDFRRMYRSPSYIKEFRHSVYIGTDTVKPLITHSPAEYYFEVVDSIKFDAEATDNLGIDTVYIEYKINDGPVKTLGLRAGEKDKFSNSLNIKKLSVTSNDSIGYRLVAVDRAGKPNSRNLPAEGYFYITFERINAVALSYHTDFNNGGDDFFNQGFEIAVPKGFSRPGLHTKHPYESPEETGDSIGYTAMLRTPVKFDPGGMIVSYNELVLVEPGETGSVFGSPEFYDYVIVEGSVNYGKTWIPLTTGYDSRYQKAWETAYNSSIVENNSTYQGDESMLVKHTIFIKPSDNVNAGDTLVIRFRLFSDPYANGWGWGIEDFHIGPLIDYVDDVTIGRPVIFPNPGNGFLSVRMHEGSESKPIRYNVFSSAGILLLDGITGAGDIKYIDISGYPNGIYLIVFRNASGNQVLKYSLIR